MSVSNQISTVFTEPQQWGLRSDPFGSGRKLLRKMLFNYKLNGRPRTILTVATARSGSITYETIAVKKTLLEER